VGDPKGPSPKVGDFLAVIETTVELQENVLGYFFRFRRVFENTYNVPIDRTSQLLK
jgi:hypothetical protein